MVLAPSLPDQPFSSSVQIRLASPSFAFKSPSDCRSLRLSASASESTFRLHLQPQPYGFGFDSHPDQIQLTSASVDFTFRLILLGIPLVLRAIPLDSVLHPREVGTCSPAPLYISSPNEEFALRRLSQLSDLLLAFRSPASRGSDQRSSHVRPRLNLLYMMKKAK